MRAVLVFIGYGVYSLGLELSEQLAPRWVWVWVAALVLHTLLCVALGLVTLAKALAQKMKAGVVGSGPGSRSAAPAQSKED